MGAHGCPNPTKKGYPTRHAATRHMWSLWTHSRQSNVTTVAPYKCACGLWHVGHRKGK